MNKNELWQRFQKYYRRFDDVQLAIDVSRVNFGAGFLDSIDLEMQRAFVAMSELERGAIANPDEKRMVGHYWLRNSELAPDAEIAKEIDSTIRAIKDFSQAVHGGTIVGEKGSFKNLLVVGIGGSALGPQFVSQALGRAGEDRMRVFFFDNTDPDGIDKTMAQIGVGLGQTLVVVISKSGGTKETRNGMLEAELCFNRAGLNFAKHAVAVTGLGSELDKVAVSKGWIRRFPMWDWVGGRTSELSAVGLLPAALQGVNIEEMLRGASDCDKVTRVPVLCDNPAALLAAMWFVLGDGKGRKDMVVLPYKDRLELFSRYLQQLVMESLGKRLDLAGNEVCQGISVYGNKGSTDQHAYVQQLRDGVLNFFVTFIEVLRDREGSSMEVEPGVTSGDFLHGFYLGTREALYESGRQSITITLDSVSAFTVGALIALFERAVGLYASLVKINAYHQPGVEAGKKAASALVALEGEIQRALVAASEPLSIGALAAAAKTSDCESVYKIVEHLAANPDRGVDSVSGPAPFDTKYSMKR